MMPEVRLCFMVRTFESSGGPAVRSSQPAASGQRPADRTDAGERKRRNTFVASIAEFLCSARCSEEGGGAVPVTSPLTMLDASEN